MADTSSSSSSSGGIGFVGMLTIVFIVLKLTGYIDWSWWWVLSPIWITALIVIGILILVGVGVLGWLGIKTYRENKRQIQRNLERIEKLQLDRAKRVSEWNPEEEQKKARPQGFRFL